MATRRRFSLAWCEGASCLVAIRRVLAASTLQFSNVHAADSSGLPGCRPGLRIRCRIFPFSSLLFACWPPSYTQPIDCANRDSETLLKPLQTLAFVGVSQPHDGDTKTADATATATPRHGHTQGRHGHVTTDGHDGHDVQGTTQPQPRRDHDGHATATIA